MSELLAVSELLAMRPLELLDVFQTRLMAPFLLNSRGAAAVAATVTGLVVSVAFGNAPLAAFLAPLAVASSGAAAALLSQSSATSPVSSARFSNLVCAWR